MKFLVIIAIIGIVVVIAAGLLMTTMPTERTVSDTDKPNQEMIEETEHGIVIRESIITTSNEDVCIGDCP